MRTPRQKSGCYIRITEAEAADLIRNANGRPLPLFFGPGFTELPANGVPWAVDLLQDLRFPAVSEGLGL